MAQNRPLWRLMSTFGANTPSGACQKWRRRRRNHYKRSPQVISNIATDMIKTNVEYMSKHHNSCLDNRK